MYTIPLIDVMPVITEFIQDKALVWLRNNHRAWPQWRLFGLFTALPLFRETWSGNAPRAHANASRTRCSPCMTCCDMTETQGGEDTHNSGRSDPAGLRPRVYPYPAPTRNEHHQAITMDTNLPGEKKRYRPPVTMVVRRLPSVVRRVS